jgi:putative peptidoglycan lipid II flippase
MKFAAQLAIGLLAMGAALWFAAGNTESWLGGSAWSRAGRLSSVVAVGAVTYFAVLLMVGLRPAQFVKRAT